MPQTTDAPITTSPSPEPAALAPRMTDAPYAVRLTVAGSTGGFRCRGADLLHMLAAARAAGWTPAGAQRMSTSIAEISESGVRLTRHDPRGLVLGEAPDYLPAIGEWIRLSPDDARALGEALTDVVSDPASFTRGFAAHLRGIDIHSA